MLFMGIVPLLVLGLIVWLVVEATRGHEDRSPPAAWAPPPVRPDARALLDERYARGEIERQEYLQRREDLSR
ncbi:MAG: SHOCT domain-containing protein [Actinobacteria bacterium]|nr:SHOCT domain-containing protein [Actinomycetota bacterium]